MLRGVERITTDGSETDLRSMLSLTNQVSQAEHAPTEWASVGFEYFFKGSLKQSFLAAPCGRSWFPLYSQGGRRSEGNNAPLPPPPPPEPDSSDEARLVEDAVRADVQYLSTLSWLGKQNGEGNAT